MTFSEYFNMNLDEQMRVTETQVEEMLSNFRLQLFKSNENFQDKWREYANKLQIPTTQCLDDQVLMRITAAYQRVKKDENFSAMDALFELNNWATQLLNSREIV